MEVALHRRLRPAQAEPHLRPVARVAELRLLVVMKSRMRLSVAHRPPPLAPSRSTGRSDTRCSSHTGAGHSFDNWRSRFSIPTPWFPCRTVTSFSR